MGSNAGTISRASNFLKAGVIAGVLLCAGLAVAPSARAQGDCKIIFDATDKLNSVPNHGYVSETASAKPGAAITKHEMIRIDGAIYIFVEGAWKKSTMTATSMQAQEAENRKNAKNVSCKYLRDESVNGEAAAVYSAHSDTDDAKSEAQVWVSKSKGLILRMEVDIDMGGPDKAHYSTRYEYSGVKAPVV